MTRWRLLFGAIKFRTARKGLRCLYSLRFHQNPNAGNRLLHYGKRKQMTFQVTVVMKPVTFFFIKRHAYPTEPCHFHLPWVAAEFHTYQIRYIATCSGTNSLSPRMLQANKINQGGSRVLTIERFGGTFLGRGYPQAAVSKLVMEYVSPFPHMVSLAVSFVLVTLGKGTHFCSRAQFNNQGPEYSKGEAEGNYINEGNQNMQLKSQCSIGAYKKGQLSKKYWKYCS